MRVYLLMVVVMLTSLCYNRFIAKGCFVVLYISVFTLGFVLFSLYFEGFCVQDWIVVVRFVVWIVQCSWLDCWCSQCILNCSVFTVGLSLFALYFEDSVFTIWFLLCILKVLLFTVDMSTNSDHAEIK